MHIVLWRSAIPVAPNLKKCVEILNCFNRENLGGM